MSLVGRKHGFTLIEILVVVAIIALLVSILVPSFTAARRQARMVACQANLRSLMGAFLTYASETKGYLPGNSESDYADWLGLSNRNALTGATPGRQPEDGTIFKYMGKQKQAYRCPDDDQYRKDASDANRNYSYTTCVMLSGANTADVRQAHYRYATGGSKNYSETDHTADMRVTVAQVLVEEDYHHSIKSCNNSSWDNDDGITDRHPARRGNVGCIDGHVQAVALPATPRVEGEFFGSRDECIRYRNKWVSGTEWKHEFYSGATSSVTGKTILTSYRAIEDAPPAETPPYGVHHR